MSSLALVLDVLWRAVCHWCTYLPSAMGSQWMHSLEVVDDILVVNDEMSIPVEELDLAFATAISWRLDL